MYQHDVSEQKLAKTLDAIVTECVSFVGEFSHIFSCLCKGGATSDIVTGLKRVLFLVCIPIVFMCNLGIMTHLGLKPGCPG